MKKICYNIIFFSVQLLAAVFVSQAAFAQQNLPDFSAEIYREAIQNIVIHSNGKLTREDVLQKLESPEKSLPLNSGTRAGLALTPEIVQITYDDTNADFYYSPTSTTNVSAVWEGNWITEFADDDVNDSITFTTLTNTTPVPRSSAVTVSGKVDGDSVSATGYILQGPATVPFIFVSPKYLAMPPEGDTTEAVSVTSFNVDSITAVFTENWIHVDAASLTNESITFLVDPNTGNISRNATIEIQDQNNPDVKDSLTIFQYVDTSNYIIATPSSSFINSGATPLLVNVNANISWQVEYTDVPSGMIDDSIVNAGSVTFNISQNSSSGQRTANISLTGITYPDVSAQIQIVQSGTAPPYIYVSPANSYVGSRADSILLNVDANVAWETDIYNDPFGMLSEGEATPTTKIIYVAANTGSTSRMAEGRIKKFGSQMPADTFRIVQEASFILLNPAETLIPCNGEVFWVNITRYNVDSILVDTTGFFGQVEIFGNDSLKITVPENTGAFPRSDTMIVCSYEDSAICQSLAIFQYSCNQPYIVVTPKFHSLAYEGGTSDTYLVNTANIPGWEVYFEDTVSWVTDTIINGDSLRFVIAANDSLRNRDVTFRVQSIDNPAVFDTAVIFQDGAPAPILLASPREQVVGFEGNNSVEFNITYQNINSWLVEATTVPEWIIVDSAGGNLLSLDVMYNNTTETRQAVINIVASNDPLIKDSIFVFQYAIDDAYIIAAPRSDTIDFAGDADLIFKITTANVQDWEVDVLQLAAWIHVNEPHNADTLSLTIDPNTSAFSTRVDTVWIQSVNQPDTNDFVVIYQDAAPQSYLIAAPREQIIPWPGNPAVTFFITSVNNSSWQVDAASVPEWINVVQAGGALLVMNVTANDSLETRIATIKIFNPDQPQVIDSVNIYQYTKFDKYLMASPRNRKYSQFGNVKTDFLITSANIDSWEVLTDSLPSWVELINFGVDTLSMKVLENTSYQTRQTLVRLFATSDTTVTDSVFLFQYAANDTLLLASPRQQLVQFFGNNALEFEITKQNADAWKVDPASLTEWISINSQGGNLLSLDVAVNSSLEYRTSNIVIFDTINTAVRDTVSVYQLAAPESYILASPRADTILFSGGQSSFHIKAVDLASNWSVDENTLPGWVSDYSIINDSLLVLDITPNMSNSTLVATIRIIDTDNPITRDSVSLFQYAAPQKYLLAAPREQKIVHSGGIVFFEITSVNVNEWGLDTTAIPGWISSYTYAGDVLSLTIEPNTTLITREASLRIFADSIGSPIDDMVTVYQYSGFDHYLLASPRERITGNLADTLYFSVDTVNLNTWQAEIVGGDSTWIEIINSGEDILGLAISENQDTLSRDGTIRIFSEDFPDAEDMVDVYQYSPFEPFIIIDPTFYRFSSDIDSMNIYTFSNLANFSVEQSPTEPNPTWYSLSKNSGSLNDTIQLLVNKNENGYYGRSSYLIFRSPDSTFINYFYFQQRKNSFNFINISGTVTVEGDQQVPLENVDIIIDFDTLHTDNNGFFTHQKPYGWVGIVRPEKFGYFFDPPNAVFNNAQEADITIDYTAFEIKPDIAFNIEGETLYICLGEQIDTTSSDYPSISLSGTFGPRGYKWFSEPTDPNLNTDSTTTPLNQIFSPELTTNYFLVMYNYGTTDTTSFTISVNPSPEARNIEGPLSVCRNQAGVIYTASGFESGEYFAWQLRYQGNLIKEYTSNITVIDWDVPPGDYELILFTYNEFSCGVSHVDVINISNEAAPPKTIVQKKVGDNMLLCLNSDVELYNYEWGWYTMGPSGGLNEKYIIPNKNDWYCRLPDNHTYNPAIYKYFVSLTFKDGSSCESISFIDNNTPVGLDEVNELPFKIFPNPTKGLIRLQFFNLSGEDKVSCSILNASGQVVYSNNWEQVNPAEILTLDKIEGLRPGIYIFRAEIKNKLYNSKIVVQ